MLLLSNQFLCIYFTSRNRINHIVYTLLFYKVSVQARTQDRICSVFFSFSFYLSHFITKIRGRDQSLLPCPKPSTNVTDSTLPMVPMATSSDMLFACAL